MRRIAILAAVAMLLAGCATAPKPTVFNNSETFQNGFEAVWTAVIEAFADNNWPIDNMEKASGLITTDLMSVARLEVLNAADCGKELYGLPKVPTGGLFFKFNIFVKPKGESSEIRVNCIFRTGEGSECLSKGLIEGRLMNSIKSRLTPEG